MAAAFDVTTKPTSLELKPGTAGGIRVTVSNRTGRPVMGLVEGVLKPATVAKWLISPPSAVAQRRYEADPAATLDFDFKVAVPADAAAQDVQFNAVVRDVLAPDDTKIEGQTVAIKVTPEAKPVVVNGHPKIPWWVFVIAAVVVIGAGLGIWLALRQKGVQNVVGMTAAKATAALTKAGFKPVTVKDTLDAEEKDTVVVDQQPKAKSELPADTLKGKTPATIVVNRQGTHVPKIVGEQLPIAMQMLTDSGLRAGDHPTRLTNDRSLDSKIAQATPAPETPAVRGSNVNLVIWAYTDQPIVINICTLHPEICRLRPEWGTVIDGQRKATARTAIDPNRSQ